MSTKLDPEYYAAVRELLPGCDPNQAYTMGAVTAMAVRDGLMPDRQLAYAASTVPGTSFIDVIYNAWKRGKQAGEALREVEK
jgi:hypothetical protein